MLPGVVGLSYARQRWLKDEQREIMQELEQQRLDLETSKTPAKSDQDSFHTPNGVISGGRAESSGVENGGLVVQKQDLTSSSRETDF